MRAQKKKKKPSATRLKWSELLIQAALDFLVGVLLLMLERLLR